MDVFKIKRGDTRPPMTYQCLTDDGKAQPLLAGTVVRFKMKLPGATVPVVNVVATILDGPTGVVQWAPVTGLDLGEHLAEFEATYGDGNVETFPDDEFIGVVIGEDV
ncbi:MAG: hypothetical protein M3404_05140 [Actinomycetota bacterium]|nr:hypothetical protein [Actinomycetota bacterium]